jgi:hypothetical protein
MILTFGGQKKSVVDFSGIELMAEVFELPRVFDFYILVIGVLS